MPEIEAFADIDPDDFFSSCSTREKKELVDLVIEKCSEDTEFHNKLLESIASHYPEKEDVLGLAMNQMGSSTSIMRDEFISSLAKLCRAYYSLPNDDIEKINELAKRF